MQNIVLSQGEITKSVSTILESARNSENEEQFKVIAESVLKTLCDSHGVFWNPYTYEHSLNSGSRRLDAVHGSTIIEYEPPRSFCRSENKQLSHAQEQSEEYAYLLSKEEGRSIRQYSVVSWDGLTITFGKYANNDFVWEPVRDFDGRCLERLLILISNGGMPLVSPMLLKQYVGPDTEVGRQLMPKLYSAIVKAEESRNTTRTKLIYTEWARLFGQVDGIETERLARYLAESSRNHGVDYREYPQAYVFALSTYIAIVAKVCAVFALTSVEQNSDNANVSPRAFLEDLEDNRFFRAYGIENMLTTDFFSWYLGADVEKSLDNTLGMLLERLRAVDYDITHKSAESVRDLFKGLYMEFTPAPLRHALGEYYTPDWLASHIMDVVGYKASDSMLDPTCGSGTFLLEALRRRLEKAKPSESARNLLSGLCGFDLNPLAVLTARASIVVFLAGRFDANDPALLPVFLADAINTADPHDGLFTHSILTEKGERTFSVPEELAMSKDFFDVMDSLRTQIDANLGEDSIRKNLNAISPVVKNLKGRMDKAFRNTVHDLSKLHHDHWNGIWCLILFDRIEAGCVHNVDMVIGNPPWVKWSNLPRQYAEFIKPLCDKMDIFSEDTWVGGIQSDISTVVTYHALERFVRRGGSLSFLITGTVFKNESSQGFRRWRLRLPGEKLSEPMQVEVVEDYASVRPFEGVSNWPTLLVIRRNGQPTKYPVPYIVYSKNDANGEYFPHRDMQAMPVPGTDAGPWIVGTESEIKTWPMLFAGENGSNYRARKGVTTDANGIYFVDVQKTSNSKLIQISNDPKNGRKNDIVKKTAIVENDDVFPLLRGRDVHRFSANMQEGKGIIVPQRQMSGDESLPATRPKMFKFLSSYKDILEYRSSYRRFQQGEPFWSVWSTGAYTFAPYKVVWKEMSGKRFVAAYVGSTSFSGLKPKVVVPDHKVYFVPMQTEDEAAYLTGFLNASMVSKAISAYATSLSLGTSVTDYLKIPAYSPDNALMRDLSELAKQLTKGMKSSEKTEQRLNDLVALILKDN